MQRQHETSEPAHRNRILLKLLSRLVLDCARLSVSVEVRKKRASSKKASERKTAGEKKTLSPQSSRGFSRLFFFDPLSRGVKNMRIGVDGAFLITLCSVFFHFRPRALAVGERLWSAQSVTDLTDADNRLWEHRCRYLR